MLNILFITADQWRGECMGVAGHPVVKTPVIDALAADGTTFLRHFANAAPCFLTKKFQSTLCSLS